MTLKLPKRLQEKTPSHARSKKQEKQLAERIGGRTTPGSGSGQYQHGDVKLRKITTIECKTTKHKSFSVTTDLLDKLDAAVFGSGEIPMFEIELELGKRKAVVMTGDALDMIVELLKVEREAL
jgi:hypothetical protein